MTLRCPAVFQVAKVLVFMPLSGKYALLYRAGLEGGLFHPGSYWINTRRALSAGREFVCFILESFIVL
ncbi:MAG: hypothetical protein WCK35_25470 [Chloroflexota bacterium]